MKIAHLTSVHAWGDTRIFVKMCQSIACHGHEAILVAPRKRSEPRREVRNGVTVLAVTQYRNRFARSTLCVAELLFKALRANADLYHLHDPELVWVGCLLKLARKKVLFDFHEDFTSQTQRKEWIPACLKPLVFQLASMIEKVAALSSDGIIAATPPIAEKFNGRRVETINNFALLSEFELAPNDSGNEKLNAVVYIGGITEDRGLEDIITAMGMVSYRPRPKLLLGGRFESETFKHKLMAMPEWQYVDFHGYCTRENVSRLLTMSRAGLVVLRSIPRYVESQPVKLFEYMAAALPVIASDFPPWKPFVEPHDCGLLVSPQKPQAIAAAVDWIFSNPDRANEMGLRGRNAVREKYNWSHEFAKLLSFYEETLRS